MEEKSLKMYFDTDEEACACMEEWKPILGLSDWIIGVRLCRMDELSDAEFAGESCAQHVNMCGTIQIRRKEDMPEDSMIKQPHELTLIHELMHFKFVSMDQSPQTIEGAFYEIKQHQLLEEMAKALFMAKYGLNRSWFTDRG